MYLIGWVNDKDSHIYQLKLEEWSLNNEVFKIILATLNIGPRRFPYKILLYVTPKISDCVAIVTKCSDIDIH